MEFQKLNLVGDSLFVSKFWYLSIASKTLCTEVSLMTFAASRARSSTALCCFLKAVEDWPSGAGRWLNGHRQAHESMSAICWWFLLWQWNRHWRSLYVLAVLHLHNHRAGEMKFAWLIFDNFYFLGFEMIWIIYNIIFSYIILINIDVLYAFYILLLLLYIWRNK